jgi:hypothetical protein
MSLPISINILIPRIGIRVVKVQRSDSVSILQSYLRIPQIGFIFNGQLLNSECAFELYNVQNHDSLVAVDSERERAAQRWIKLTDESDDFSNSVQCAINPKCRGEFLRLRDVHRMRLEAKPKTFRRITRMIDRDVFENRSGETTVPEPSAEISSDPLPMLFRGD